MVYIREAHTSDVWQDPDNLDDHVVFASPKSFDERSEMGQLCVVKLGIKFPAVVDNFDNVTERAYTGWPDRLYVIDRDGRVSYKSGPGPVWFQAARSGGHASAHRSRHGSLIRYRVFSFSESSSKKRALPRERPFRNQYQTSELQSFRDPPYGK